MESFGGRWGYCGHRSEATVVLPGTVPNLGTRAAEGTDYRSLFTAYGTPYQTFIATSISSLNTIRMKGRRRWRPHRHPDRVMLYSIIMRIFATLSNYLRRMFTPRSQAEEQCAEEEIVITGPRDVPIFSEKPSAEQIAVSFHEVVSRLPVTLLTADLLKEVGPAGSHALRQRLITLGLSEAEANEAVCEVLVTLVKLRLSRGYVTDMGDIVKHFSQTQTADGAWVTRKVILPAHIQQPVTDADLGDAENRMKVRLPRLFRRLYTEVGNGGFGPGYGLVTLAEIIEGYQHDLSIYNDCDEDAIELPWPEGLIYLGTEGCTYNFYLDCRDPRYRVIMFSDSHYQERLEEGMLLLSATFDDWIGHWAMADWASECFTTAHAVGDVSFPE